MAMNSTTLKQVVNAKMTTKVQLQADVWAALEALGIRAIDKTRFPNAIDLKDISEAMTEIYWLHIKAVADLLCDEIIDHIVTNAVINTDVSVTSVTGVMTGQYVSGPGAGTGIGNIT